MDPAIQDPLLAGYYTGLPRIPCVFFLLQLSLRSRLIFYFLSSVFCDVSPYGFDLKVGGYETPRAKLSSEVAPNMTEADLRFVSSSLVFFRLLTRFLTETSVPV